MAIKNEIDRFKKRYIANNLDANGTLEFFSLLQSQNAFNTLINAFINSQNFDRPDGYWFDTASSILYVFEHFEFDCSSNNRNGSKLRKNLATASREISEEMSSANTDYDTVKSIEQGIGIKQGNTVTYHIGENGDIYRNNYIANFQKSYEAHSNKLHEYIENCKQVIGVEPNKVITTFLIEDITLGGTYYKNSNGMGAPVNLISTKQFIELFRNSSIDYVLFGRLQEQLLTICDRAIIDNSTIQYVDLYQKEFFIFPAMLQITVSHNIKKSN